MRNTIVFIAGMVVVDRHNSSKIKFGYIDILPTLRLETINRNYIGGYYQPRG